MPDPPPPPRGYTGALRRHLVRMPEAAAEAPGMVVLGRRIRSIIFTTDVAILRNHNADAALAVYPFTPQPVITDALIHAADVPIFCGVGGGVTSGRRSMQVALHAEFQGALGVVLNRPAPNDLIQRMVKVLEIPVIVTVASIQEDLEGRIRAGVDILNVSGARETPAIVRRVREIDDRIPVMATGGRTRDDILRCVEAGADAVTITPPTSAELLQGIMVRHRESLEE